MNPVAVSRTYVIVRKAAPVVIAILIIVGAPMMTLFIGMGSDEGNKPEETTGIIMGTQVCGTVDTTGIPLDGAVLSYDQVAKLVSAAGFPDAEIDTAVAVARGESEWNPRATNNNTNGTIDYGLFQINSIHQSILSGGDRFNPADNAKMAFKIWQQAGNSWTPWVAWKTGAYRKYLTNGIIPNRPDCTPPKFASSCSSNLTDFSQFSNGSIPASAMCPLWADPTKRLRSDAAAAFDALSKEYVKAFGSKPCVTDAYRSLAEQIDVRRRKPHLAAIPGTSNHGLGQALDLGCGAQNFGTEVDKWLRANAPKYGWVHPSWADPGGSKPEPWHWEYGVKSR